MKKIVYFSLIGEEQLWTLMMIWIYSIVQILYLRFPKLVHTRFVYNYTNNF